MSLLTTLAEKAFRAAGATETRQFAASKNGRLVGDWTTQNNSANQEVKMSLRVLRARSRQLSRDDDYMIGFLKKAEANIIGEHGIKLQVDARNADRTKQEALNQKIETEFKLWSRKRFCDVTEQSGLRDMQALALRTLITDGEFLIRYVFDPTSIYGLRLQMLDVDWLDEDYNDPKLPNGNRVVMSVELDHYDKPVAYYFTHPRWHNIQIPNTPVIPNTHQRIRIPADQICHRFPKWRVGQNRGIPFAHGAMMRINMLGGYEEAELVNQRIAAANMAFVSPPVNEGQAPVTESDSQPIPTEVVPGQIAELPAGYTVHEFDPNPPNDGTFSKRMLRAIAVSLGISYSTLTSDLESVNYSSIRAGTIEERAVWKIMQGWLAEHLLQDIYEKWLLFNSRLVPTTKLPQVMYPIWRGRGFDWVDPSKDTTADIDAINRGIKTMTEVIAERGGDFEETMEQHAAEKKVIERLGLEFTSPDMAAKLAADQKKSDEDSGGKDDEKVNAKSGARK